MRELKDIMNSVPVYKPNNFQENNVITRIYSNYWGIVSDTIITYLGDNTYKISGRLTRRDEWNEFVFACMWGACKFSASGWNSLEDFVSSCGYCFTDETKTVFKLNTTPGDCPDGISSVELCTNESQIPLPPQEIIKDEYYLEYLNSIIKDGICEGMNKSHKVIGDNWKPYVINEDIESYVSGARNKNYILKIKRNK